METDAHRELLAFLSNLADIERDIERFERSERPNDKTGVAAIEQRLEAARNRLKLVLWTSDEATQRIKGAEDRLSKPRDD